MEIDYTELDETIRKDRAAKIRTAQELGYSGFYDAIESLSIQGRTAAQIVIIFNTQYGSELIKTSCVYNCISKTGSYLPKAG